VSQPISNVNSAPSAHDKLTVLSTELVLFAAYGLVVFVASTLLKGAHLFTNHRSFIAHCLIRFEKTDHVFSKSSNNQVD
jgi:hypothetical protein